MTRLAWRVFNGGARGGPVLQCAGHQSDPRSAALVRPDARAHLRRVRRGLARRARAALGGGRRAGGAAVAGHGGAHAGGGALIHRVLAAPAARPRHLPRVRAPPHPPRAVHRGAACRRRAPHAAGTADRRGTGPRPRHRSTCRTPTSTNSRPARGAWPPPARKRASACRARSVRPRHEQQGGSGPFYHWARPALTAARAALSQLACRSGSVSDSGARSVS